MHSILTLEEPHASRPAPDGSWSAAFSQRPAYRQHDPLFPRHIELTVRETRCETDLLEDPPVEADEIARVRTHNGRHLVVHRARLGGGSPGGYSDTGSHGKKSDLTP
jgi:hypothetical protein